VKICDDLMTVARFLVDDSGQIDSDEALRIGLAIAEFVGHMRAVHMQIEDGNKASEQ
jgi:hypothetical protein